jgi:hypothetical protein
MTATQIDEGNQIMTKTKIARAVPHAFGGVADHIKRGMPLRIVAVNFSGNTGKTTLIRHLVMPAFPGAELIRIESINNSGSSEADLEVNGKKFEDVAKLLFAAERHTAVDIGASNVELVKAALRRLGDAHEEVDLWMVPCMPNTKIIKDTVATLRELMDIGVDPAKVAVIKNKVADVDQMDDDFAQLQAAADLLGVRVVDAPVLDLDVYSDLDNKPGTFDEIAADGTNFRAKMLEAKKAGKDDEAEEAVHAEFRRKNAKQGLVNLAAVRAELFGAVDAATEAAAA